MDDLITAIEAFQSQHELSDSQFGTLALNDKNLIPQLRGDGGKRKRRLWPETEQTVRDFMAAYVPAPRREAAA
jgi:hypothetical protein